MNVVEIKAVIGTNAWGGSLYGKILRGSFVEEEIIGEAVKTAVDVGIPVFDTAQDYGLGKCQPMIGRLCEADTYISSKYTPLSGNYKTGQVRKSLEKDLREMKRDYIDIYWLHLPNSIEENLKEFIDLYREGKIKNIGVSNFTLEECKQAKRILNKAGIPLYAVQNHYSLINREWEKNGLLAWCKENGIAFWAWAVLEEGTLTGKQKNSNKGLMRLIYSRKIRRMQKLFALMNKVGERHGGISIAQVAQSFVSSKGIVPICGCRKPEQVKQLKEAVDITLTPKEIQRLEEYADKAGVKVMGADMFRFAVKKKR